ncbi:HAD-like domain-containing protein [Endogone sp. FLAS-F59071]|nr:HAD-like domain-containing protein [Endogone sp. FLAS-F59071]|eukprot:RUS15143.1 HAD-like domain-containing protein [Endogone sp. FLAS-F59071]
MADETKKRPIQFVATWNNSKYPLQVPEDETVATLKETLATLTNVPPKRQKLLGFVKGKLPDDSAVLSTLSLKPKPNSITIDFLMMGTPDANLFKDPDQVDLPDVVNDLDFDYFPEEHSYMDEAKVKKKLRDTIAKTQINLINPLRDGKRLLVMDLDYTLFDCKSTVNNITELMRPGMHSFLTAAYEHYDIVIWSQTSWRALEAKITELGILTHQDYKIAFVLDITSMISITTRRDGKDYRHQVKPLDLIWTKYPERYSAANTIHVDDLSRNFALNPDSGLKISAFKNAPVSRQTDRELFFVARYLLLIAEVPDFKSLNHKKWKAYPGVAE